ncbi:hypothetical protein [Chryseobacterium sp. SIMBA_038]|uniref:hypothetical protein n=2 Tax=Pseudomonadati TaxID=3379134 RepID=UPI00397BCD4D
MRNIIKAIELIYSFHWIKEETSSFLKEKIFKNHILAIIEELKHEKLTSQEYKNVEYAINSDIFKNGIFDFFLNPNDYKINIRDLSVVLNMAIYGHSDNTLNINKLVDISVYIIKKLRVRSISCEYFKLFLEKIGKTTDFIERACDTIEIREIHKSKRLTIQTYFNIYSSDNYFEEITIYYPGEGKSWLDWTEENSLKVHVFKYDIPKGFFLYGFDYYSDIRGKIRFATRTNEKNFSILKNIRAKRLFGFNRKYAESYQ